MSTLGTFLLMWSAAGIGSRDIRFATVLTPASDTVFVQVRISVIDSGEGSPVGEVPVRIDGLSVKFAKTIKANKKGEARIRLARGQLYRLETRKIGFRAGRRDLMVVGGDTAVTITMNRLVQRLPDVEAALTEGTVAGKVIPFGARIFYTAIVRLYDSAGHEIGQAVTWDDGSFSIRDVPGGGPYSVVA